MGGGSWVAGFKEQYSKVCKGEQKHPEKDLPIPLSHRQGGREKCAIRNEAGTMPSMAAASMKLSKSA